MVTSFPMSDLLAGLHQPPGHQLPGSSIADEFNYCIAYKLLKLAFNYLCELLTLKYFIPSLLVGGCFHVSGLMSCKIVETSIYTNSI